jgi:hypothetical protein
MLSRLLRYSLVKAEKVVALDHFMKRRIVEKGVPEQQVVVLPPWAHDDNVKFDLQGRAAFRQQHNLDGKFVVMYAGNHSPCHPLDTLMEAARCLRNRQEIMFCFVGGGSEQGKVKQFAAQHKLTNVSCLPYQDFEMLSATLSAADLHVVVMGNEFVGIVHPSKIYNILTIGSPFLYIGPKENHVSDLAVQMQGEYESYAATHGDVETVVNHILVAKQESNTKERRVPEIANTFSQETLLPRMIQLLDCKISSESEIPKQTRNASYVSAAR